MMIINKEFRDRSVEALKRKLISQYVNLMSAILLGYSIVFYFVIKDSFFAACTFAYSVLMFYTFMIIRKSYNIKVLVHLYLTYAPLFAGFVMLDFWKYSAATAMWLLPVPLGAHIFLGKKYVYIYSVYIFLIIVVVSVLNRLFKFDYFSLSNVNVIVVSDTFVGLANLAVFFILLYYNEEIRNAEIEEKTFNKILFFEKNEENEKDLNFTDTKVAESFKPTENDKEIFPEHENIDKYVSLFEDIKNTVEGEAYFKDINFTISQLSNILKSNNLYVYKAIKLNGFSNFNHYLNTCRIENVKKLLYENDISKVTLMYIYTESGFSNQSTFNRVFKKIEGITPSEFITIMNKEKKKNGIHL
ncbi:helix-turn-helix domain-containing protein [Chryseobacterium oranimense]|uniref:helix-turn-helix domain-containing protein n=1 Tax=Chryseobacterium oranimense TaxID=421058 RepID=UPI0021AF2CF7|nr:helix-turn-helix domain-containing protein [Chryseobacterium oranimense]UWX58863.1 helix-turn-helix domain-containing protein [Chryseobacterium oranimense]